MDSKKLQKRSAPADVRVMSKVDLNEYQFPLLIAKKRIVDGIVNHHIDRYAGTGFFLDKNGKFASCRHIFEMVQKDEVLLGKSLVNNNISEIKDICIHPEYDFLTGLFESQENISLFPATVSEIVNGRDVMALGMNFKSREGNIVTTTARLLKGHIVSIYDDSDHPMAKSALEVSFPSLNGFSGSALVDPATLELAGMMFSNQESSIQVHAFHEVNEDGFQSTESINRIVEFGLAHPVSDILQFINEVEEV